MLNLDLSQHSPVQSDSQYANVPLPSAHLVVIEESEIKDSNKDGYTKGQNLVLDLTILASSTGNDFVGEKLALYVPINGFEETAIKAGMKRLSTLSYTLGVGGYLANKEDLHGQNFIVVLEKDGKTNFPRYKRILNVQGQEIADASGNFRPCELKETALQVELDKLLDIIANGGQAAQPNQTQGFGNAQQTQSVQQQANNFANAAQTQAQGGMWTPQNGQSPTGGFGGVQQQQTAQTNPQQGFGNAQPNQTQGFGGQVAASPWGSSVNQNNGQA